MVRIVVITASKHGATREIGEAIAMALAAAGFEAQVRAAEEVTTIDDADAVILGSGVYAGHWLGSAKDLAERLGTSLRQRPVWLFSSGPLGNPPAPASDPVDVATMMEMTAARGHRVFAGKLTKEQLGFGERAIIGMVHAPYGDFRNWPEINEWAHEIAGALAPAGASNR